MRQGKGIAAVAIGVLFALGVLLALTAGRPARAQIPCSTVCTNYIQGQCSQYTHYSCNGSGTTGPAASYGAIAYGVTSGAWGSSYKWGSRAKAESSAMKSCAEHGNDCEVIVWFDRKCGAVATGDGTNTFWGLGDSEATARTAAQDNCAKGGGKQCEIQAAECSK